MFSWRITKYNPQYRNQSGWYTKEEWTSYSDIGKEFNGTPFTFKDYSKVEEAYATAIQFFMEYLDVNYLTVSCLEKSIKGVHFASSNHLSKAMIAEYYSIKNGKELTKDLVVVVARLILREKLWCKLTAPSMFVHFGWDYYMYIGANKPCTGVIKKIEKEGLFIEPYESPYL